MGQPWSDSPLTPEGTTAARSLGEKWWSDGFDPDLVYSSPYLRTMATATALINHQPVKAPLQILPVLSEFQPDSPHKLHLYPEGMEVIEAPGHRYPLPESVSQFETRVATFLDTLCTDSPVEGDLLLVTHGAFIRTLAHLLANRSGHDQNPLQEIPYLTEITIPVQDGTIDLDSVQYGATPTPGMQTF